jgi:hypothetical protein
MSSQVRPKNGPSRLASDLSWPVGPVVGHMAGTLTTPSLTLVRVTSCGMAGPGEAKGLEPLLAKHGQSVQHCSWPGAKRSQSPLESGTVQVCWCQLWVSWRLQTARHGRPPPTDLCQLISVRVDDCPGERWYGCCCALLPAVRTANGHEQFGTSSHHGEPHSFPCSFSFALEGGLKLLCSGPIPIARRH